MGARSLITTRTLGVVAAALAALTLAGVAGAAGAQLRHVDRARAHATRLPGLWDGSKLEVRPSSIDYTGDASGFIGKLPGDIRRAAGKRPGFLRWTVWSSGRAAGNGTVWFNTCTPDCADGRFQRMPLTLTATRARNGHFTRMTLHYHYRGQPVADTRCVPDTRPLVWGIVFRGRCG
jgi:hypothetical protein